MNKRCRTHARSCRRHVSPRVMLSAGFQFRRVTEGTMPCMSNVPVGEAMASCDRSSSTRQAASPTPTPCNPPPPRRAASELACGAEPPRCMIRSLTPSFQNELFSFVNFLQGARQTGKEGHSRRLFSLPYGYPCHARRCRLQHGDAHWRVCVGRRG